jgi:hypothetical protein
VLGRGVLIGECWGCSGGIGVSMGVFGWSEWVNIGGSKFVPVGGGWYVMVMGLGWGVVLTMSWWIYTIRRVLWGSYLVSVG